MNKNRMNNKNSKVLILFLITFTLVCAAGIAMVALYVGNNDKVKAAGTSEMSDNVNDSKTASARTDNSEQTNPLIEKQTESTASDETAGGTSKTADKVKGKYDDILADKTYMAQNGIYEKKASSDDKITLTFAGDILFDSHYAVMSKLNGNGGTLENAIDPAALKIMNDSDIMMINNEFPYSDRGTPTEGKKYTFRADPATVSYLTQMGADIVSLANNHAYDYGADALMDTFSTLDGAGIPYVGAGANRDRAEMPISFIVNDTKITFISATQIERNDVPDTKAATDTTPGVFRCMDDTRLLDDIKSAKADSDYVIVYIHWGTENEENTDWLQEKQAPEIAAAGADLIVGDHSHCLQRLDYVGGVPVIYSMGNFWFNSKTVNTGLLQYTINKNGTPDIKFIPCLQKDCKTTLLSRADGASLLDYMRNISQNVSIDADGNVTAK